MAVDLNRIEDLVSIERGEIDRRIFSDPAIFELEMEHIFGRAWLFLCHESQLRDAGDFFEAPMGRDNVLVVRQKDGGLKALLNTCMHRGNAVCRAEEGNTKNFMCTYHGWTYDLSGKLVGVPGLKQLYNNELDRSEHGLREVAQLGSYKGFVFATMDATAPPLEEYLGESILPRIERVLAGRKPVVLGRYTQALPNNWKLYMENVKDSYHASILHLFFTTFELNRLSQRGGIIVDPSGGHHVSFSAIDRQAEKDAEYAKQNIRSESEHRLADPSLLQGFKEFADDITLQILSVFPTFVLQQIQNTIAVRQIVPRGTHRTDLNWTLIGFEDDTPEQRLMRLKQANLIGPAGYVSMEDGCVGGFVQRGIAGASDECAVVEMGGSGADSSESRVTEASVRGFWKAYRAGMGI